MSGIAALIRLGGGDFGAGGADRARAAAMTAAMAFRGPDGIALWDDASAAIGHCAMNASQATTTPQPLVSDDGLVALSFDGYLANCEELRTDLLARGARLHAGSDAELALRAYEAWGADFARYLDGEFAAVLWDGRRHEALCVRDHHGLRPLYWHWDGRTLIAASEIAAVLAALPVDPPPNQGYLAEIAADAFYSADETVWQGIMRLLPAHVLRADAGGVRLSEYWVLPTQVDILYRRDEEYFEHYHEVLSQSVRRAARSHRPLACEVSGGLDSSSVYCMAHLLQGQGRLAAPELRGYTLAGPPGSAAEETAFARIVGAHTGTAIAEYPLFLPPLDWFARRAAVDRDLPPLPNAAMSITLDEAAAADGCRVSLSGIGGDQWCDGTHYYYGELFDARDWARLLACYRADVRAGGLAQASGLFARLGPGALVPPRWRRALRSLLGRNPPFAPPALLQPRFQRELAERRARYEAGFPEDYRASYKLRKLRHPIWSLVLDQGSRQRARSGLEMRSPMMSRAFIEFSARTPENLKLHGGISKYLHRHALAGILPPQIANRQTKAEFSIAYEGLFDSLRAACQLRQAGDRGEVTDPAQVAALFEAHFDQPIDERCYGEIWGTYVVNLGI